eukprot:TRINITY_DN11453_c0_g1_i1.p1 TRINITY_DN11453_c0_g1~~TRINITY_DN11453_c0_g1_i1.p1  ORF type:complete len:298 (+),score=42.80 TRINITY_DN11453_c0_g1_i1:57-950(+)
MTGVAALFADIAAGRGDGVRAAGMRSGSTLLCIDGCKPLHVTVTCPTSATTAAARRRPSSAVAAVGRRDRSQRPATPQQRPRSASSCSSASSRGGRHRRCAEAPQRKRPQSAPNARTQVVEPPPWQNAAAPHIPGYMGFVPGVAAKTVHGVGTSAAHSLGQSLREFDPNHTSDAWLRRGQWPADRMATYNFTASRSREDGLEHFTPAQQHEAHEANKKLGQTFGLLIRQPMLDYMAGDRFVHGPPRLLGTTHRQYNAAAMPPAGQCSYEMTLNMGATRWANHNAMTTKVQGNPRCAY